MSDLDVGREMWSFARLCLRAGYDVAESHARFPDPRRTYEALSADLDARARMLVDDPRAARLASLVAENERLRGPEGTKLVRVAVELLPWLSADWSEPVRIRIDSEDGGVLTLMCKREPAEAAALTSSRETNDG